MEKNLDDIIGAYLEGTIGPGDLKWLKAEMQKDTELNAMIEDIKQTEVIEQYVNDQMPTPDRKTFEARLSEDEDLKNALVTFIKSNRLLELEQHLYYTELFKKLDEKEGDSGNVAPYPSNRNNRIFWWLLLGLTGLSLLVWLNPFQDDIQDKPEETLGTLPIKSPTIGILEDSVQSVGPNSPNEVNTPPKTSVRDNSPPATTIIPPVSSDSVTPPLLKQETPDSTTLDSLKNKAIAGLNLAKYLNEIKERDKSKLNVSGASRSWENAFLLGNYDSAVQILTSFFEENQKNLENWPKQAYYLGIIYLYHNEGNVEQAVKFLEIARAKIGVLNSLKEQQADIDSHLLRAYLLSDTPLSATKALILIQEHPGLVKTVFN